MIRDIVKDESFLSLKSTEATIEDLSIGLDLLDTLKSYSNSCVGMAANMIGVSKNIICIKDESAYILMFNAKILEAKEKYQIEEGCLCLEGTRNTSRYKNIKVKYKDQNFKTQIRSFRDFTAEIIQHELDHVEGKII